MATRQMPVRVDLVERRRRKARVRRLRRFALVLVGGVLAAGGTLGFAFAGSESSVAEGVRVAGVDVGGLSFAAARRKLQARSAALAQVPVVFRAGERRFEVKPRQLGVEVDWRSALETARHEGGGFGPIRGFRRLGVRFFGSEVVPTTRAWEAALEFEVAQLARAIDRPARDAKLVLRGLRPQIVPAQPGRVLDRRAAADVLVRALASFDRRHAVWLPLRIDSPAVATAAVRPAARRVRTALSAPVTLEVGGTRFRVPRRRLAQLLRLPAAASPAVAIGGERADAYFAALAKTVARAPRDATFEIVSGGVRVVPAQPGRTLDVPATARAVLAAALRPANRVAHGAVVEAQPERTTAEARAMGIAGVVGSYSTTYGGDANRIHNVQLVSHLVDDRLIAPGQTFSFNGTTGERNAAKGFLEAPVIINGELQNGIGGGVCQVSTTVFNAAYEAGLPIAERTNHALYISHYPQGRDATVDYPALDLRFVNDTGHWLLLRTFVGPSELTVNLYGTPTGRRVETETAPLVETGAAPMERQDDPDLEAGRTTVVRSGVPPRATSVRRTVFDRAGKVLREDTFASSYRGEPGLMLVGTKPKPKPKPEPKPKAPKRAAGATPGGPFGPGPQATATPGGTPAPAAAELKSPR